MTDHSRDEESEYVVRPNKTQLKREMAELKALGEQIIAMPERQRARLPLSAELLAAIDEFHRIPSREARRRHLQYVGKLMRSEDIAGIRDTLATFEREQQGREVHLQRLGQWRERLIEDGDAAVTDFVEHYPAVDLQTLRQVMRNARREREQGKPGNSARKLMRLLRDAAGI
ncbi:ribosome biogenesis factor YjgA [Kushneria sinocarnis]|nr:ribosome biogenesis factor YjgA [Kushneria sinocarnis]